MHKNGAISAPAGKRNWGCGEAEEAAANLPKRNSTREIAAWQEKSANTLIEPARMTDRREAQRATWQTSRATGRSDRRIPRPRKSRLLTGAGNTRREPVEGTHLPAE